MCLKHDTFSLGNYFVKQTAWNLSVGLILTSVLKNILYVVYTCMLESQRAHSGLVSICDTKMSHMLHVIKRHTRM